MKKLFIILFATFFLFAGSFAQNFVAVDAEEGNRDVYFAKCWSMEAITVSNSSTTLIDGSYSFRTNQSIDDSNTSTWITSPWMLLEAGSMSFKSRLDGEAGGNRSILIQYIPYDANGTAHGHGTAVEFDKFDFPNPINNQTTIHEVSIKIPEDIIGTPHKIFISFVGDGGSARVGLDNLKIPGKYYADPSNGCMPLDERQVDSDGDGVIDEEDDYPNDKYRAYNNYFPAKDFSTLMFEDLWPSLGDYDFNDLVVDYRINRVTDGKGEIVEVIVDLRTRAAGAGYRNGFGIEFTGIEPSKVIEVEGTEIKGASIHKFDANGLESDTKYVTVIAYDDVFNVLPHLGQGTTGVNTTPGGPFQEVNLQQVVIRFKKDGEVGKGGPVYLKEIGYENFNPFLIANQKRGYEIHLPGKQPTALIDKSLFGTADDSSSEGANSMYRSKNGNLPWALDVTENIPYLKEGYNFNKGYVKFTEWVKSNGSQYEDWYLDKSGYRNSEALLNIK
ncbi:MAG TPA: LruC domain-containing protein [Lunatimonas sp.]|nr:LruC domain-containing protein [Lunatimonas sp.]